MTKDVYIVSAVRTAVGSLGGSLSGFKPSELGARVIKAAIDRAGLAPSDVEHVVLGQVIQSQPKDAYLARVAALDAGIPTAVPALTLNRLCGSGLEAVISAAQMIRLGECSIATAGGAESMSRAPHVLTAARWGQKMGNSVVLDAMVEVLSDPFGAGHMGHTAENVAERYAITRAAQDELAVQSQQRAARATSEGRFKEQILPIEISSRSGTTIFDEDEHIRGDTTLAGLARLQPAFKKNGSVTAGNASGINDGAAALVLASAEETTRRGLQPMARIVSWAHAGVDPDEMGIGPIRAVPSALERAGLHIDDMDVIESNEAFAAQACAVARELRLPSEKTNINGSGIALGHPIGATGAILTVKAIYELARTESRYGLITMCIGGGQGIALVLERPTTNTCNVA